MHDSRDNTTYLSCSSRPIIENSSGIGFAEYPSVIANKLGIMDTEKEEWYVKELVEDFNWLKREHSPNWRISEEKIDDNTWSKILDLMSVYSPLPETILPLVKWV
jgi:tubulin-specific chaperone C